MTTLATKFNHFCEEYFMSCDWDIIEGAVFVKSNDHSVGLVFTKREIENDLDLVKSKVIEICIKSFKL
jgi:hypothetical protein